jgi:dolichol-phosphate mannosyltransferase
VRSDGATDVPAAGAARGLVWAAAGLVVVSMVGRVAFAASAALYQDEASYWEWSRFPSLGYLDAPPMVAWVIAATTRVLGHSGLGIRAGALLLGAGTVVLTYTLARRLFGREVALRAVMIVAALPFVAGLGLIVAPQGPMLFFHLLALNGVVAGLGGHGRRSWMLAGAALGLALLSDLAVALAVAALAAFWLRSPAGRPWLRRAEPYLALAVALVVVSPYLWWNAVNDWAGLRLALWDAPLASLHARPTKVIEFAVEQVADASPFLLVPVLASLFTPAARLPSAWRDGYRLLRWQSLVPLAFFLVAASVTETHPQWTIIAYPPAAIALGAVWTRGWPPAAVRIVPACVALAYASLLVAGTLLLAAPPLSPELRARLGEGLRRRVALSESRLFAWPEIARQLGPFVDAVTAETGASGVPLVFARDARAASLLSYYRRGHPAINLDAYLTRGRAVGAAQWYYLPVAALEGRGGIVLAGPDGPSPAELLAVFERARDVGAIEQRHGGRVVAYYRVLRVEHFRAEAIRRPPAG